MQLTASRASSPWVKDTILLSFLLLLLWQRLAVAVVVVVVVVIVPVARPLVSVNSLVPAGFDSSPLTHD